MRASSSPATTGFYTLPALPPGGYAVTVELAGFKRFVQNTVTLATGERVRLDVTLTVGGLEETVNVTGEPSTLRTESGSLGQVVSNAAIAGLPLNGRSFISLITLAPGVASPPGSAFPRINGGRPRVNEYLFDGVSVLQPEPGQVAFTPVVDAIDEFKVETNSPSAEFGRFNGGVINLTTKSGTNALSGTAFAFTRHESLNARNAFAPRRRRQASVPPPAVRRRDGRADRARPDVLLRGLSGHASGDRPRPHFHRPDAAAASRHLHGSGRRSRPADLRSRNDAPSHGRLDVDPTTTMTRDQFANNTIPADRIDPAARALLDRYPLPTSSATANNYTRVGNETTDQDQFDARIDHRLTTSDRAFARLSYARDLSVPVTPLPDGSGNITSGAIGRTNTKAFALASNYTRIFSDRLLNELRVGYTRRGVDRAALSGTLPTYVIDGFQQLGPPANTFTDFRTDVTHIVNVLSWQRGAHTIKGGADLRFERLDVVQPPSPDGNFRFSTLFTDFPGRTNTGSSLASFLLGQVQTFSIDVQPRTLRPRAWVQEYFIQDDWKPAANLTLSAGVRYTLNLPSTEVDDQGAIFNLETQQLDYLGRDGYPRSGRDLRKNNWGPRLGAAWRLGENTVVRSGYGLVWIELAGITTPFINPQFPFLQTVTQRTLDNLTPAFTLAQGPSVAPLPTTARRGPWAGRVHGRSRSRRGLRAAVEPRRAARHHAHALVRNRLHRLEDHAHRLARHEHQSVDRRATAARIGAPAAGAESVLRTDSRVVLDRRSDDFARAAAEAVSALHHRQLLSQQRRRLQLSRRADEARTALFVGAERARRLHALQADGRRLVGVRCDGADRAGGELPGGGQLQSRARTRSVDRRHPARVRWKRRLAGADRKWRKWTEVSAWRGRRRAAGGLGYRGDRHPPVGHSAGRDAGDQLQRLRRLRHAAPESGRRTTLPSSERTTARWFNTEAFAIAPQFTLGSSSRNPVRGPGYSNVDVAVARRFTLPRTISPGGRHTSLEIRVEAFNLTNTPPLGAPNTVAGTPGFGAIIAAGDPRVLQLAAKSHVLTLNAIGEPAVTRS